MHKNIINIHVKYTKLQKQIDKTTKQIYYCIRYKTIQNDTKEYNTLGLVCRVKEYAHSSLKEKLKMR